MPKHNGTHSGYRSSGGKFRTVVFFLSLMVFVASFTMVVKNTIESSKAKSGYSELRALVSREEYEKAALTAGNKVISSITAETELTAEKEPKTENTEEPVKVAQQQISMDFSPLKEVSSDIIGWIRAEGTNIDYPIAQTDNNDFYLSHLYNGEWNNSGTIFADYRNIGDFSDRNTVIYGHYMKNGTMFQALEEYKDQEFYNVNPTMTIFTPNGDYTVELICGTVEDGNNQFVKFDFDTEEDFMQYIEGFRSHSTFVSDVELHPGDKIVSLCTCSYEWENARYMVIGRLVPVMEERKLVE